MKTIKIITALAIVTGFASLGFAGAGPDYWMRMNQAAKDKAATEVKAAKPAKTQPAVEVAGCATCSCCAKKA